MKKVKGKYNTYIIKEKYAKIIIKTKHCKLYPKIDLEDIDKCMDINWNGEHNGYPCSVDNLYKYRKRLMLHHFIYGELPVEDGYHIHHTKKNQDGTWSRIDCRKRYLKKLTISEHSKIHMKDSSWMPTMLGKTHSEETKLKMSQSAMGKAGTNNGKRFGIKWKRNMCIAQGMNKAKLEFEESLERALVKHPLQVSDDFSSEEELIEYWNNKLSKT